MSDAERGDEQDVPGSVPPAGERRWRHPSELGAAGFVSFGPAPVAARRSATGRGRAGVLVLVGLGGVLLLAGLVTRLGTGGDHDAVVATTVSAQAYRVGTAPGSSLQLVVRDGATVRTVPAFSLDGSVVIALAGTTAASAVVEVEVDGAAPRPARMLSGDSSGLVTVAVDDVVPQVALGSAGHLHVGDVLTVGAPQGANAVVDDLGFTNGQPTVRLRTEAPAGQLVWSDGRLVAVVGPGDGGVRSAVPVEVAEGVAASARRGATATPYLGVVTNLPAAGAQGGAAIASVTAGSPAAQAGLRAGDVVRRVESMAVSTPWQFALELRRRVPGDSVRLTVERDGVQVTVTVALSARG